jgi:hypothetical protein
MAACWAAFTAVDLACGWVAYRLEGERLPMLRMVAQRFGYRQLLYAVVLRALTAAASGPLVGWGKLERSGKVGTADEGRLAAIPANDPVPLRAAA